MTVKVILVNNDDDWTQKDKDHITVKFNHINRLNLIFKKKYTHKTNIFPPELSRTMESPLEI